MTIKQKPKIFRESDTMINMPKDYKKPTENLANAEKVKAYYERLQKK